MAKEKGDTVLGVTTHLRPSEQRPKVSHVPPHGWPSPTRFASSSMGGQTKDKSCARDEGKGGRVSSGTDALGARRGSEKGRVARRGSSLTFHQRGEEEEAHLSAGSVRGGSTDLLGAVSPVSRILELSVK